MIELASEYGYDTVTVRALAQVAGVSTRTFYEHFKGKEECFFSTYDALMTCMAHQITTAQSKVGDELKERVHAALEAMTWSLAQEPKAARLCLVEVFAVDPSVRDSQRRADEALRSLAAGMLATDSNGTDPIALQGVAAGTVRIVRSALLSGRVDTLPKISRDLGEWALTYIAAAVTAREFFSMKAQVTQRISTIDAAPRNDMMQIGDERALLLSAATRLAGTDGYRVLSASRICSVAGVSRRAFDEHFDDVNSCFVAAVGAIADRVFEWVTHADVDAPTLGTAVHTSFTRLSAQVASDPIFGRLVFVELPMCGSKGIELQEQLVGGLATSMIEQAPESQRPAALVAEASLAAAWDLVRRHVVAGKSRELPGIAKAFSFLMLATAMGIPTARVTCGGVAEPRPGAGARL